MRFHKAETAFIIFVLLAVGAAGMLCLGLIELGRLKIDSNLVPQFSRINRSLSIAGVLLATACIFGVFFIYPLIRTHLREEGKLRAMTETLSARSETFEQAALTDALTGMQNRRYFDDALREYLVEFQRIGRPVGLMILDLDHFKQVNDTYGHDVGDDVLRSVAACLHEFTRHHDVVARLGGEEFAVVAPNMDRDALMKLAERIRKAIASLAITVGNVRLRVTTSVGLAVWDGKETADDYYRRADRMLYESKRLGRNRVSA